MQQGSNNRG
jgi:hypothetical protein